MFIMVSQNLKVENLMVENRAGQELIEGLSAMSTTTARRISNTE